VNRSAENTSGYRPKWDRRERVSQYRSHAEAEALIDTENWVRLVPSGSNARHASGCERRAGSMACEFRIPIAKLVERLERRWVREWWWSPIYLAPLQVAADGPISGQDGKDVRAEQLAGRRCDYTV
jgi:hypothetical protein